MVVSGCRAVHILLMWGVKYLYLFRRLSNERVVTKIADTICRLYIVAPIYLGVITDKNVAVADFS
jgi:hypothetical protein